MRARAACPNPGLAPSASVVLERVVVSRDRPRAFLPLRLCVYGRAGICNQLTTCGGRVARSPQSHRFTYNAPMHVEATALSICDLSLGFGEGGKKNKMARPYGVALLLAGCDAKDGPVLYHTDPSGTYVRFKAKAIGNGSEGAQTSLEEAMADGADADMTIASAETLALSTLKQVIEEKINGTNVEIASVTLDGGFRIYSTEEVEAVIGRL